MKGSRWGVARGVALLALGGVLAASCLQDLGGPGAGRAQFAVVPSFTGGGAAVVDFDRLRVTVERGASSETRASRTAVDTVIPFPAGTDSVELTLLVPLEAPSETFQVFIRFVTAAGDTVFRNDPYPQVVVAFAGSRSALLEAILIYVGVGFDAAALTITTPDTTLAFGETLPLAAVAVDAGAQPIPGTPVAWTSLNPAVVTVANAAVGLAVAGTTRGTARIMATTPTGLADTLIVDVVPLPGQIQIVSGDGQFANAGGILPLPLRVRVTGSDGFGVIVPVRFRALTGGSPTDVVVVADAAGFAELTVTVGPVGPQTFEASATGVAPVTFTAYAAMSVAPPFVVFAGDSSAGASSGVFRVNGDGSDRTRISDLGRSGQVYPRQSRDHGRVAFGFLNGLGTNELLVTARTGDTLVGLVTDTSARRPRWSADGTSLAFECGDGVSPRQDVCVIPDVTAPLTALNRIGDGGGKVFVTDFTGDRLDGPGSFAWDPKNPKRLIVVRDSLTAQAVVASRLWTVGFDGASPVPLSPPVLDGGTGLLRIDGPLDVTFDGATIVFSAFDPGGVRALYVIRGDGTQLRPLTAGPNDWNPVLSPDGRRVLFLRDSGCSADYWLIDLEGTGEGRVSDERFCAFDLTILGHDWSPDGKDIVLAGSDGQGHTLIYSFPVGATDYLRDRRLIGRGVDLGGFVGDIQPSWRP